MNLEQRMHSANSAAATTPHQHNLLYLDELTHVHNIIQHIPPTSPASGCDC